VERCGRDCGVGWVMVCGVCCRVWDGWLCGSCRMLIYYVFWLILLINVGVSC